MPYLFLGYILFALGTQLIVHSDLGASPWVVLYIGIVNYTPLSLGQASQICGFAVLFIAYILDTVPGLGSVFSMIFIGIFMDIIDVLGILTVPQSLSGRFALLILGIITVGWGTCFYIKENLGTGPRDALMVALLRKTNKPIWFIRALIEAAVLFIGYLLKGPVGIGTLITAGTLGFSVQSAFKIAGYNAKKAKHLDLIELANLITCKNKEFND
ncbi:MAG: membrane protein [Clostridiales bacterium]|nr:membrane protein [Clostridiales bacterium]